MNEPFRNAVAKALGLLEDVPEKYRTAAFGHILNHVLGQLLPPVPSERTPRPPRQQRTDRRPSFAEYYAALEPSPRNNPARIAAAIAYAEDHLGERASTRADIELRLAEVRRRPANLNRDFKDAARPPLRLIMSTSSSDHDAPWELTQTGRGFINERLNNDGDG